ncbi:MAG: hypothetical protein WBN89_14235 [Prochlorococcaceae cyanobacterium]
MSTREAWGSTPAFSSRSFFSIRRQAERTVAMKAGLAISAPISSRMRRTRR